VKYKNKTQIELTDDSLFTWESRPTERERENACKGEKADIAC